MKGLCLVIWKEGMKIADTLTLLTEILFWAFFRLGRFVRYLIITVWVFFRPVLDDDSEPILGQWFEETISPSKEKVAPPPPPPPPPLESSPRVKSPNKQSAGENGNILASRKDPELVRPQELGPGSWGGSGQARLG